MSLTYITVYLIAINAITFMAFGIDKYKAVRRKYRISVRALFMLAIMGGSIGAIFGMLIFNHKTSKKYFRLGIPLILIIQLLVAWQFM